MKLSYNLILTIFVFLLFSCGNSNDNFDASGTFEANEVMVSAEGNGKINVFNVNEGQVLEAFQQIGLIDTIQLALKKQQLLAGIYALQSRRPDVQIQIAVIHQQLLTARSEQQRVENLVKANAASQKQLDDLNAQITLLEKQLMAQKSSLNITNNGISAEIATLETQIAQIDDQLKRCQIVSPIYGTVLNKYAEAGELAVMGRTLFKIADLENMYMRAYVTSEQLSQIKLGAQVSVFSDFGETTRQYTGTVSWISDKSEFTPKTIQTKDERANLVYAVKIAVKNDGYLKIGMFGQVKFKP